jgi:hypothetical protein
MKFPKKLPKLIRMLSSDSDGERIATLHAIGRVLSLNKMDWHTLADYIERGAPQKSEEDDPFSWDSEEPTYTHFTDKPHQQWDHKDWEALINFCMDHLTYLNERETEFVTDMNVNLRRWMPTKRQGSWLRDIYKKINMKKARGWR